MMGYDLTRDDGKEFEFTGTGWRNLITFAEGFGFVWPEHDVAEEGFDRLTAEESGLLADAIGRGLGVRTSVEAARVASALLTRELVAPSKSAMFPNNPIELSPKTIDYWREFIAFARGGGFTMYF